MSKERPDLLGEAVKLDGNYLEDMIPGYMTYGSTGRNSLKKTLSAYTVGAADGERIKSSNYPAKDIKISYVIKRETEEDLIRSIEQLANILDAEQVDVVFNNEPDKFITGTPIMDSEPGRYHNAVKGTFTIHCAYPFKRSLESVTLSTEDDSGVTVDDNSAIFTFNYDGTYPAYPLLRAEFASAKSGGDYSEDGDCGYIAFLDEEGDIIQLGNPEVVDLDPIAKNTVLVNSEFSALTGWTPTNVSVAQISDANWNNGAGQTQNYAKPSGTASLKRSTAGAVNYEFDAVLRMCVNVASQTGSFEALCKNGTVIVTGIKIIKSGSGTTGKVQYILNNKVVGTDNIDLSYYNTHFGYCRRDPIYTQVEETVTAYEPYMYRRSWRKPWLDDSSSQEQTITRNVLSGYNTSQSNLNLGWSKNGKTVVFSVGNLPSKTFKSASIASVVSEDIELNFTGNLHTLAVHSCSMIQTKGLTFNQVPNVFTAGDVVKADCNNASVMLYRAGSLVGHLEPQYGALGNDWERFTIKKGSNVIKVVWSDWVNTSYKPKISISFNEVYI